MNETTAMSSDPRRDALIDRLFHSASGAFNIFTVYIGDQLGFYRALTEEGPMMSEQLATRTGTHELRLVPASTGAGMFSWTVSRSGQLTVLHGEACSRLT